MLSAAEEASAAAVYNDGEITLEHDGTYTVSLAPWYERPIKGIPSRSLALEFVHAAYEAMQSRLSDAFYD